MSVFSKVLASRPVNRQAGVVAGGSGTPDPKRTFGDISHWIAPPQTKRPASCMPDLRGLTVGRLTVVGLLAEARPKKPRWLVRCTCGDYEARTSKALRNPANANDRCHACRHVSNLQRDERRRREGLA